MTPVEATLLSLYGWGALIFLCVGWTAIQKDGPLLVKWLASIMCAIYWPALTPIILAIAFVRFNREPFPQSERSSKGGVKI